VPVRIKLRIRSLLSASKEVTTVALVNSGFEADTPQLLIPLKLAQELSLHARLLEARIESYGTVGGPVRLYVLPSSVETWVDEEDARSPKVVCDAVISDTEYEVLISDYLAGMLGIMVEDFREGIWKLKADPPHVKRQTHPPQVWR